MKKIIRNITLIAFFAAIMSLTACRSDAYIRDEPEEPAIVDGDCDDDTWAEMQEELARLQKSYANAKKQRAEGGLADIGEDNEAIMVESGAMVIKYGEAEQNQFNYEDVSKDALRMKELSDMLDRMCQSE